MNKPEFIYMLIEAVIFLSAFAVIFIKLGGAKKVIENLEEKTKGLTEWKAATNEKVASLELSYIQQNNTLAEMNKNIISISTKMDLLLEDKLKLNINNE